MIDKSFDFLTDKDLIYIITTCNKDYNYIIRCLRSTLYMLLYCNYNENAELSEKEIVLINEYKNKNDYNNLFRLVVSDAFSLKELCLS